jgi:hypothetical protein
MPPLDAEAVVLAKQLVDGGRYRSPPRPKSLREIMKEKESNERD